MIKLNRTTEYGLMALRHMSRKKQTAGASGAQAEVTSAREISDFYGFPFEITAKTLQRLKDTGLIQSAKGARGGYTLQRELSEVNLAEFLTLMEGPQTIVACTGTAAHVAESSSQGCEYHSRCEIRSVMTTLNTKVYGFLSGICLADLAESLPAAQLNVAQVAASKMESVFSERVNS